MVLTTAESLKKAKLQKLSAPRPGRVAMVDPTHFRIDYAINPYMTDAQGQLKKVDSALAKKQWQALKAAYEKLGLDVAVVKGDKNLPDMVFAANQSFPFLDLKNGKKSVVLSRMRSEFRRPEVAHFETFYKSQGYAVYNLEAATSSTHFEGNGDALLQWPYNLIWGGYGERTSPEVYEELSARFGYSVAMLKLVNKNFYHLDTCFSILNESTVVVQKEAFDDAGLEMIRAGFANVIFTELDENLNGFVCNCHSPDGKHVIVQAGAKKFRAAIEKNNFQVIEVETGEFIKSGGSVFCMKMMFH